MDYKYNKICLTILIIVLILFSLFIYKYVAKKTKKIDTPFVKYVDKPKIVIKVPEEEDSSDSDSSDSEDEKEVKKPYRRRKQPYQSAPQRMVYRPRGAARKKKRG